MKIKCSSAILAVIMFIMSLSVSLPVFAETTTQKKYDVLTSLGFFKEGGIYYEDASVTRYEIINAIVSAIPEDKKAYYNGGEVGFSDVAADDSIAYTAYNAKYLGLTGDDEELCPYEAASFQDAAEIVLRMLGYGDFITDDYVKTAAQVGITKSIGATPNLTMRQLVVMLYNALDTPVLKTRFSLGDQAYTTNKEDTFMTEVLGCGYATGQIRANSMTGLDGEHALSAGYVKIGSERYTHGAAINVIDNLGAYVKFYYRETEDESEILYMEVTNKSNITEFDAEDITSFENLVYTYEVNDGTRKRTAKILKSTDIIYNGKHVSSDFTAFRPETGKVKLIDNDNDNYYEIAVIENYDVVVVGMIDKTNGSVRDKHNTLKQYSINIYEENTEYVAVNADNEVRKFSDIFRDNVIFVAQSLDKSFIKFIISDATVTGNISSISPDTIEIDGKSYKTTSDFTRYYSPDVNSYGMFYLDPKGRVGSFTATESNGLKAGYLVKVKLIDDDIYSNVLRFKMFTENNSMEILYSVDEKFYFTDGSAAFPTREKVKDLQTVSDTLNANMKEENGGGQLILYRLNDEGRVKEIEMAAPYTNNIERSDMLAKNSIFRQTMAKTRQMVKVNVFLGRFRLTEKSKSFNIPDDLTNEKKFGAYSGTQNCFTGGNEHTAILYAKQSDVGYAEYAVRLGAASNIYNDYVFAVAKVREKLNDDDEIIKSVTGLYKGTVTTFDLDEDCSLNEISKGDVLRITLTDDNIITALEKVYDYKKPIVGTKGGFGDSFTGITGYAYDFEGTTLKITGKQPSVVTTDEDFTYVFTDMADTIYKYDLAERAFITVDYNNIPTYKKNADENTKIFVWYLWGEQKDIFIYE